MRKSFPVAWLPYAGRWAYWLEASGYTSETVTTRARKLRYVAELVDCDPLDVTSSLLVDVFARQEWKRETRKAYTATVRSFYQFLVGEGLLDVDPTQRLPHVRRERAVPHPCPEYVLRQAVVRAQGDKKLIAMLKLGAECGLRRSEIAQVNSHDVIEVNGCSQLLVHGKGRKERVVPLPDDLAVFIQHQYGFVFPGRFGGHVESSYVTKHLSHLLGEGYSAHSLRHRYATRMYEGTHDLLLVSKLLGHESVETTQVYLSLQVPDSVDIVSAVSIGIRL
ncbi:tyrosine-type recombinase/integrase [Alloscardovia criceti]|uniref:tyrosine-type recombinase/integrase n=1 Tax=Alloscardovia criceti TaxID=356828 RepID=UPI001FDEB9B8|nr:tyrosine-type recombinase/integrase [Alloscardovia criceti]